MAGLYKGGTKKKKKVKLSNAEEMEKERIRKAACKRLEDARFKRVERAKLRKIEKEDPLYKQMEQKGLAVFALSYPDNMQSHAIAQDMTERLGLYIDRPMIGSLQRRFKMGAYDRVALLRVDKAEIRYRMKELARSMQNLFDSSEDPDFLKSKAYVGHATSNVYKQVYGMINEEIRAIREEENPIDGDEESEEAEFELIEGEEDPEEEEPEEEEGEEGPEEGVTDGKE